MAVSNGFDSNESATKLSYPGVFPCFRDCIAETISEICGGSMLMLRSAAGSMISGS